VRNYITIKFKFPRIYRFITEAPVFKHLGRLQKKFILAGFLSLLFISAIIYVFFDLYRNLAYKERLEKERDLIINQIKKWHSVAEKHKGYRDAYFQIALLEYRLGNFDKSREYLTKTLLLDPNYKEGKELESLLKKN